MRHLSTIDRARKVQTMYKAILAKLGDIKFAVSRTYIYEKIRETTHLSIRTIQQMVNHPDEYDQQE